MDIEALQNKITAKGYRTQKNLSSKT